MGRDKGHHRKKHRHSRSPKHPLASGPAVGASSSSFSSSKLLKYASLGKTRKLRALLLPADGPDAGDPAAVLNAVADSSGATALHQVRRPHVCVVAVVEAAAAMAA